MRISLRISLILIAADLAIVIRYARLRQIFDRDRRRRPQTFAPQVARLNVTPPILIVLFRDERIIFPPLKQFPLNFYFCMLAYLARCPRYSNKPKGAVAVLFLSLPASSFYSVGARRGTRCAKTERLCERVWTSSGH